MSIESIILASESLRRKQLMEEFGLPFQVVASKIPEMDSEDADPIELVKYNAFMKAQAVQNLYPDSLIIAADTEVYFNGKIFGKPKTMTAAKNMLTALSGNQHTVYTGLCLLARPWNLTEIEVVETKVYFKQLTNLLIDEYLQKINPFDKSGSYSIFEHTDIILDKIEGSLTNVAGLPMEYLKVRLKGLFYKHVKV